MPLIASPPPVPVPILSGFDYVTVDSARRRVYAAHNGSSAVLIVDADAGTVLGQVKVGPLHGIAVNPADGHVFTADGFAGTVSEVDPVAMKVLRSVDLGATLDAMIFDAARSRIFVDEDDGPRVFLLDAKTLKRIATVKLPSEKLEYLAVDNELNQLYQNIDDKNSFAILDADTLKVKSYVKTPELQHNHPLQYDPGLKQIVTGGAGVLSAYDRSGKKLGQTTTTRYDQCDLDAASHTMACAGGGVLAVFKLQAGAAPTKVAEITVPAGCHTVAIDGKARALWAVWAASDGDYIQRFKLTD